MLHFAIYSIKKYLQHISMTWSACSCTYSELCSATSPGQSLIEAHPSNFLTLAYVRTTLGHTLIYPGMTSYMNTLVLYAGCADYFGIPVNRGAGFWSGCNASQVITRPCHSCLKPPAAVLSLLLLSSRPPNESGSRALGILLEHPVGAMSVRPPGVNCI